MIFEKAANALRSGESGAAPPVDGPETSAGDVLISQSEAMLKSHSSIGKEYSKELAYDRRIDAIFKATGERRVNPMRVFDPAASQAGAQLRDPMEEDRFADWLKSTADKYPEHASGIRAGQSIDEEAGAIARSAEEKAADIYARAPSGILSGAAKLAGGLTGGLMDPANQAAFALGPWGAVGQGAKAVLWNGIKVGAINAGVEVGQYPLIKQWREQAGLEYTGGQLAVNAGLAALLGFGLDAGIRGAYRGAQKGLGREAILKDGKVVGYRAPQKAVDPEIALEVAAQAAEPDSVLGRAVRGDVDALDEMAKAVGVDQNPAYKGARAAYGMERDLDDIHPYVEEYEHLDRLAQSLRHAQEPDIEPPATAIDPVPPKKAAELSDVAPQVKAERNFTHYGKPVEFTTLDPNAITTDAAVFQFKGGGDAAGATDRLSGVKTWDNVAAGRVVVFVREGGEQVIADGHQRLALAKRLSGDGQKIELQGFVFREADGWTPPDVRAIAAKKNLQEGTGSAIDAAKIMRERPDIIDSSVPLSSKSMRQARSLTRLSDEAFDAVVGGVVPPGHAAMIGDLVPNKGLHRGMLEELMRASPSNEREARFIVNDLLQSPVHREEQMTLLGVNSVSRPLFRERAKIADAALKELRDDKRIFSMLSKESERIEEAGNQLSADANVARSLEAEGVAAIIEKAAATKGPVSDWLNEASRAVIAGTPIREAARQFSKRVRETLERDGLSGILPGETRPKGIDDVAGPEGKAQADALEEQLSQDTLFALRAYHGSPHDFDKFSLEKIGTGEGAQAYGHGLYFAESPGVAKSYQEGLRGSPQYTLDGTFNADISRQSALTSLARAATGGVREGVKITPEMLDRAKASHLDRLGVPPDAVEYLDGFQGIKPGQTLGIEQPPGRLYEVNIKANKEDFLDWDAPYGGKLKELLGDLPPLPERSPVGTPLAPRRNADALMELGDSAEVAKALREAGIPGIKYKDQMSRGADGGTYNYVVFDDSLIEIVAKDGKPVSKAEADGVKRQSQELFSFAVGRRPSPSNSGSYQITARASDEMAEILADVQKVIDRLPDSVTLELKDRLTLRGADVDGQFNAREGLIHVALASNDPARVARHEEVHALRSLGLLRDEEFQALYGLADKNGLRKQYETDKLYGKLYKQKFGNEAESRLQEEVVAEMVAQYGRGVRFDRAIDRILDRIWKVLSPIIEVLGGRKYVSPYDVFEAIELGTVGARRPTVSQSDFGKFVNIGRNATDEQRAKAFIAAANKATDVKFGTFRITRDTSSGSVNYRVFDGDKEIGSALIDVPRRLPVNPMGAALDAIGRGKSVDDIMKAQPIGGSPTRIEVDDAYQRQGIATALLDTAESDLKAVGAILWPGETNMTDDFLRFYAARDYPGLTDSLKRRGIGSFDDEFYRAQRAYKSTLGGHIGGRSDDSGLAGAVKRMALDDAGGDRAKALKILRKRSRGELFGLIKNNPEIAEAYRRAIANFDLGDSEPSTIVPLNDAMKQIDHDNAIETIVKGCRL